MRGREGRKWGRKGNGAEWRITHTIRLSSTSTAYVFYII